MQTGVGMRGVMQRRGGTGFISGGLHLRYNSKPEQLSVGFRKETSQSGGYKEAEREE